MVLTGEGSDEILGGYPKHVAEKYAWAYHALPSVVRRRVLEPLVFALPYRFWRAKTAVRALSATNLDDRFACWFGGMSSADREVLASFRPGHGRMPAREPFSTEPGNSALRRLLYFDQTSWLPDNLLERGDRMTMAASLEARMPFMDVELAGFVSSLPDRFRVRGTQTKWILRQAMRQVLPKHILERPKVGFKVPVNEWFRGSMRDYLCDHLLGPDSRAREYFERDRLAALINEHIQGRHNHEKVLWSLLTFEIWHRLYV
jgi:asparagine synthase (glutamine-hydrolysing)